MTSSTPTSSAPGRPVEESFQDARSPDLAQPEWGERWPSLVQGLTTPGPDRSRDFRLFDGTGQGAVERWGRLGEATGCDAVVHARQPHGSAVRTHGLLPPGLHLAEPADAHSTREPGVLLTVTVADCVPVFVIGPERRVCAVVHAGWRGAAAGILETAIAALLDRFGVEADELLLHLGPAICGSCYEVGPEVHDALGEAVPSAPEPVDLRANLARRAARAGLAERSITVSTLCTRCGPVDLFSHRGGDVARQVAFLGWRGTGS